MRDDWPPRDRYEERPYRHRWWFPDHGYKSASFGSLLGALRSGDLFADWAGFLARRTGEDSLGALRGGVWLPIDGGGG